MTGLSAGRVISSTSRAADDHVFRPAGAAFEGRLVTWCNRHARERDSSTGHRASFPSARWALEDGSWFVSTAYLILGLQGAGSQGCPSATQMPQIGSQQISRMLHVTGPQAKLVGTSILGLQGVGSQVSPSAAQVPQVGLQQTSPTLQVAGPQPKLT